MTDVIVLGIDGATWDILSPLIDDGRIPNIESLLNTGTSGTLKSTFPPITAPAWLSMATGLNPGKTGVFYFLNRDNADSFDFSPLDSQKFHGKSFWDVLSAGGHSVGIFNYPMLYPPYDINGFMVSGLGSDEESAITHPESLKDELDNVSDGYHVKVPYADPKYQGRPEKLKFDLLEMVETREAAIEYLLQEKDPDHFFGIISATDWAQHYFWRYADEQHILYDPNAGHKDALYQIWERVDEVVGTVADLAREEEANMLIVSDHGFGPTNKTFYSNEWLKQQGFLHPADQPLAKRIKTICFPYLREIGEIIIRIFPHLNDAAKSLGKSVQPSIANQVNFDRSIVFAPEQNLTCGMFYMLSDSNGDKQEVISRLESLPERQDGPEKIEVYEPTDLYNGEKIDLAPDILFQIDNFECEVDPRPAKNEEVIVEGPSSEARNGGHNQEGIIIGLGPDIASKDNLNASIYDIAPIILFLHNAPVPKEMDGQIPQEMLKNNDNKNIKIDKLPIEEIIREDQFQGRNNMDVVQEQLNDLGYIQ